jgi:hypothetical protein
MIITALIQTSTTGILSPLIDATSLLLVIKALLESLEDHDPETFQRIAAAIIPFLQWAATAGEDTWAGIIAEPESQGFAETAAHRGARRPGVITSATAFSRGSQNVRALIRPKKSPIFRQVEVI